MGNRCDYKSSILPLPLFGDGEMDLHNGIRCPLYMLGLGWTFLGIAIISDIFMNGIEKVTAKKKRIKDKSGRTITVAVWNDTVANLTLMALGSSAPEILLSVIEIVSNKMFLGDLGAGTIVGSAAFNLLCISAVCVSALPDNEVRYIKEIHVYIITASCSVFAYLWLMFVLMAPPSPNVCETWEAVLTLIFFPILVYLAYIADRGFFKSGNGDKQEEMKSVIPDNVTKDELVQIQEQIRQSHPRGHLLSHDEVCAIMKEKYFSQRTRAYWRHKGMAQALGINKAQVETAVGPPDRTAHPATDTYDDVENEREKIALGFTAARYAFLEGCGEAQLVVERQGPSDVKAMLKFKTRPHTAIANKDYEETEGMVIFEKEETKKTVFIRIIDDDENEENQEFFVDLYDPTCEQAEKGDSYKAVINRAGLYSTTTVVIIDDDEPGVLQFQKEEVETTEGFEEKKIEVVVERKVGASGTIGCSYHTEDMKAIAGTDYVATSGKIEFGPSIQTQSIPIMIKPTRRAGNVVGFNVVLNNPVGGCAFSAETDGGNEQCICHVTIAGQKSTDRMSLINKMETTIALNQNALGQKRWKQQFYDALFTVGGDGDDDEEEGDGENGTEKEESAPSKFDWAMHISSLPFKLLFAFVPPVDYCGGWACFFGALFMIAIVTAFVGDMANLVGCTMNINPEITAITFVALGTSLPDTFASKASAEFEPYADNCIGNVTGSNSVNVFLGLGLSWTIAAFYWEFNEPTKDWLDKVEKVGGDYYDVRQNVQDVRRDGKAVFVVPAGSLWFNLMVFSTNALCAIQHLYARRRKWGGELGGPKKGWMGQHFSACFLVTQWFIYIGASSVFATINEKDKK